MLYCDAIGDGRLLDPPQLFLAQRSFGSCRRGESLVERGTWAAWYPDALGATGSCGLRDLCGTKHGTA